MKHGKGTEGFVEEKWRRFKACCFVFAQKDQRTFPTLIASIFTLHPYCVPIHRSNRCSGNPLCPHPSLTRHIVSPPDHLSPLSCVSVQQGGPAAGRVLSLHVEETSLGGHWTSFPRPSSSLWDVSLSASLQVLTFYLTPGILMDTESHLLGCQGGAPVESVVLRPPFHHQTFTSRLRICVIH